MNTLIVTFLTGLSFIFLTEGLLLVLSPKLWRQTMEQIIIRPIEKLRIIGKTMGVVAVIMATIWHIFPDIQSRTWLGFAAMTLLEGMMFGIFPHYWKDRMAYCLTFSNQRLRQIGLALLISGAIIFVLIT